MNIIEITREQQKSDTPIRLAAYCRVSSNSEDQLHSFAAQIRYYTDYVRTHPQYVLADIFADEGLTGTSMKKRDELNRMLRECKKGKIDRIIVKSVSRFARNTEELLVTLRMLADIGVSVYFEEQGIDTDKMNMEMIVTFPGMAAQQESVSISENMRWSYKKRMESGDFNCTYPAYGFQLKDGQLAVNEDEAAVVQEIFTLYLQGIGKQRIANMLNDKGICRRKGKDRWYHSTVHYVLNNERYMGDSLLQKSYTTETLPFRKVMNSGEREMYYVENSNPAIVSCETYQAVQKLQAERRQLERTAKPSYPLTAMLRCPDCGRVFRRQVTKDITYWLCSGKSSGATACQNRRVREDAVYTTFVMMLQKLNENRHYLLGELIHQIETMQSRTSRNQDKIYELDKKIADLGAQNLVIARLHTKGILNAADYAAQTADIGSQIAALRTERRKKISEDEDDELLDSLKTLNGTLEETDTIYSFDEELFRDIVENVTVEDNAKLTFTLIGGIKLTEQIPEKGRCKSA